ncbi:uncharacterized protein RJT21DRAFT_5183 [Scheffersomyces amazonensis]|uniref:uncharacterized protein n=1 Tax=Scheffersomyces amazonensis TaxID=1078765 RepID=UPI00315C5563
MFSIFISALSNTFTTVIPLALTIKSLSLSEASTSYSSTSSPNNSPNASSSLSSSPSSSSTSTIIIIRSKQFLLNYWLFYIIIQYIQYQLVQDQFLVALVLTGLKVWLFYGKDSNLQIINGWILSKIFAAEPASNISGADRLVNFELRIIDPLLRKYITLPANYNKHGTVLQYYLMQLGRKYSRAENSKPQYNQHQNHTNHSSRNENAYNYNEFESSISFYAGRALWLIRYFMMQLINYTGESKPPTNSSPQIYSSASLSPTTTIKKRGHRLSNSNSINNLNSHLTSVPNSRKASRTPSPSGLYAHQHQFRPYPADELISLEAIDRKPRSVSNQYPETLSPGSFEEYNNPSSRSRSRSFGEIGNEVFRVTPMSIKNMKHSHSQQKQQTPVAYPIAQSSKNEQLGSMPTPEQHMIMRSTSTRSRRQS